MKKEDKKIEETQKVLVALRAVDEGYAASFYLAEYEIPQTIFKKYAVKKEESNPDIFAVFLMNATKKFREIFGI